jgi:catechol 2,3-dioxygenase-like lactoylglutathione lyase family enzyme
MRQKPSGVAALVAVIGLVSATAVAPLTAQESATPAQAPAAGDVLGSSHFSPVVENLDSSIDFYGGVLGLTVPPAREPGPRPWDTQQTLRHLQGWPDTQIRYIVAAIPGEKWGVELIEFEDAIRKAIHPRIQDPGATTLILTARDIDVAYARLKQAAVPVVTAGGAPIPVTTLGGQGRAVIVNDPDGHFVELIQPDTVPETTAPSTSNVIGARIRVTAGDTEKTLHVFRDLLGLRFQVSAFAKDQAFAALTGVDGAEIRRSTLESPMPLEFLEFKGVARTPMNTRIFDPGSTKYPLRVRDLDAAIAKLKSTGASVVSLNGEPYVVRNVRYANRPRSEQSVSHHDAGAPDPAGQPITAR